MGALEPGPGSAVQLSQQEKLVGKTLKKQVRITPEELDEVTSKRGLIELLQSKNINARKALVKLRAHFREEEDA